MLHIAFLLVAQWGDRDDIYKQLMFICLFETLIKEVLQVVTSKVH